ncbi:MAG: hypothetical protein GTN49_03485 [candidate division Zixibacteria bacterium]|nr:hypothetical protein [candidate division Zixibacteria bacterium]
MLAKPYRILLVVGAALIPAAALAQPMAVDDVVKLLDNNISESIIITRIEETNSYFSLSTDDLIKLKEAGASDDLVRYMIVRKPGGPPATEPPGEPRVNVTGRVSDEKPATTPQKWVELTVNVDGTYVVTSQADLNVWYAAYLDGERVFYKDQWTSITSFTTPETGARTTKRILEPGSFTVKVPAGPHALALACWSGRQVPTDDVGRANIIYTKKIKAVEGQPLNVNLVGETDTSSDTFVIVR